MADAKISALTDDSPALATDQIPVNRGGVTARVNADTVGALAPAANVTGRFINQYQYTTSGAGNHTTQLGAAKIKFILVGGGGGGAGVAGNAGNAAFSGGGCAGGYTQHVVAVSANTAYAFTVGAGGAAAANNAVGGAGGETNLTIAAAVFRANGGAGGGNMANGATNLITTANAATAANTANTPAVSVGGQGGTQGVRQNGVVGWSGHGGCSLYGGPGMGTQQRAATAGTKGENAVGWGSGGAGGCGNSNANGGNGANGIIVIEEYSA